MLHSPTMGRIVLDPRGTQCLINLHRVATLAEQKGMGQLRQRPLDRDSGIL